MSSSFHELICIYLSWSMLLFSYYFCILKIMTRSQMIKPSSFLVNIFYLEYKNLRKPSDINRNVETLMLDSMASVIGGFQNLRLQKYPVGLWSGTIKSSLAAPNMKQFSLQLLRRERLALPQGVLNRENVISCRYTVLSI